MREGPATSEGEEYAVFGKISTAVFGATPNGPSSSTAEVEWVSGLVGAMPGAKATSPYVMYLCGKESVFHDTILISHIESCSSDRR